MQKITRKATRSIIVEMNTSSYNSFAAGLKGEYMSNKRKTPGQQAYESLKEEVERRNRSSLANANPAQREAIEKMERDILASAKKAFDRLDPHFPTE